MRSIEGTNSCLVPFPASNSPTSTGDVRLPWTLSPHLQQHPQHIVLSMFSFEGGTKRREAVVEVGEGEDFAIGEGVK